MVRLAKVDYLEKFIDKAMWPAFIFLSGLVGRLFKQSKALKNINIAVARKDIIGIWEKARDRGYTTDYEYETMMDLIDNYYALGGNGLVHQVESMFKQLPMKTNPLDKKYETEI